MIMNIRFRIYEISDFLNLDFEINLDFKAILRLKNYGLNKKIETYFGLNTIKIRDSSRNILEHFFY